MDVSTKRKVAVSTSIVLALTLSACGGGGGGGGGVNFVPPPMDFPPPPPPSNSRFNTAEYQRSNGAVQAQAVAAYDTGATGAGIIAGVVDSGLNPNITEFAGRIHPQSGDLAGNRGLQDEDGHGTGVAAVLLAARNDSGIHGVAFGATLLVLKTDTPGSCANTSPDGGCNHEDVPIARALDQAVIAGARVINLSLGGTPAGNDLRAAIDRATAAGIVLVISASNDFENDPLSAVNPDPFAMVATEAIARGQIIIAGATDSNRTISTFSNRAGTGADAYLTALGVGVRTLDNRGAEIVADGTSFSAPVISGAVALLAQAFPNLSGRQIVDILLSTADDLGAAGTDSIYGRGELNLARAFAPRGQTSLAATAIKVPTNSSIGTLSTPMGDATGKGGPKAVILDEYGRAFNADFSGSVTAAKSVPTLESALAIGTETRLASNSNMAIALSVANRRGMTGSRNFGLNPSEKQQARAMAASIITRLDKDKSFAIGIARSSGALLDQMTLDRAAAFVTAYAASDNFGFFMRPKTAFAYRQKLGGFGLNIGSEFGDARVWTDRFGDPARVGYRDYGYNLAQFGVDRSVGPMKIALNATYLGEKATILGATGNVWTGTTGAKSWFADAHAQLALGRNWQLGGAYRRGWTRLGAAGLRQNAAWLQTDAWSLDLTRLGVFSLHDQLALRFSQPLRVAKGGVNLNLPTSYDWTCIGLVPVT